MLQNLFFLLFLSAVSVMSVFGMDSHQSTCYYSSNGATYIEPILKPAKPTPKTKKPTLLFEYFGLPELYNQQAAINPKQLIVQFVLNKRPQWHKKTTVCEQGAHVVTYDAAGDCLVTGNGDTMWFADQAGRICATKKYLSKVVDVISHPTEQALVVACENQTLDKIDLRGKTQRTVGTGCIPAACAVNAKTNELAIVTAEGLLKIWSLTGGKMPDEIKLDIQGAKHLAFHEQGNHLALAVNENVQVIERSTGTVHRLDQKIGSAIKGVTFKPDGKLLAVSQHGFLTRWEPKVADKDKKFSWKCKQRVLGALFIKRVSAFVDIVKFHPQGHLFATIQQFCDNIKLWDTECNNIAIIPYGHAHSFTFHPTMHEFAVGGIGSLVETWQQEQFPTLEQLLFRLILKQYLVKCIAARKKPGYPASYSSDKFIDWMSEWFYLEKQALLKVWRTFSASKQIAIRRTYVEHAKKVGDIEEGIASWQRHVALYRKQEQEKEQQKIK